MQTKGAVPEPIPQRKGRVGREHHLSPHRTPRACPHFLFQRTHWQCEGRGGGGGLPGLLVWLLLVSGPCAGPRSPPPRLLGRRQFLALLNLPSPAFRISEQAQHINPFASIPSADLAVTRPDTTKALCQNQTGLSCQIPLAIRQAMRGQKPFQVAFCPETAATKQGVRV